MEICGNGSVPAQKVRNLSIALEGVAFQRSSHTVHTERSSVRKAYSVVVVQQFDEP